MFKRSSTDSRVVVIVDFQHLAYKVAFGGAPALSGNITINGQKELVDTTIPSLTIKTIHRWANKGINPIAVCFDTKGSGRFRMSYLKEMSNKLNPATPIDYKGSRSSAGEKLYQGVNLAATFLNRGGVCCYRADGYEADDLVKACIDRAKEQYPDLPIHVITGDMDLVPLVDDQVSVFYKNPTRTYSVEKIHERRGYIQITPENYQEVVGGTTAFKNLYTPYNTVLLAKILRGDKSDGIPGKPDWKPKMYSTLLAYLDGDGYDLGNMFRYGKSKPVLKYRDGENAGMEIPQELQASVPRENIIVDYMEPEELSDMLDILKDYVEPDDIEHIRYKYIGMNLNGAIPILGTNKFRVPAKIKTDIKGYLAGRLQEAVGELQINLPQ